MTKRPDIMAQHNELGQWGEDMAALYMEQHGYRIIERNWKSGHKEIDIIATDGHIVLFVEVKTRRTQCYGQPYEAVDWKKQRNLMAAMRSYAAINHINSPMRFDIIAITGSPSSYKVEQLENAVSNFTF